MIRRQNCDLNQHDCVQAEKFYDNDVAVITYSSRTTTPCTKLINKKMHAPQNNISTICAIQLSVIYRHLIKYLKQNFKLPFHIQIFLTS
ncbi:unnamed protein product [Paramecium octaurelia]|uniref:Uncharacterized protein n=1 Tax=Paramecium octaurelia TaxID=43137 RepID=A0A8S1TTD7_PAROT|nr:unnamed protein product [Paramecium octaurelia]